MVRDIVIAGVNLGPATPDNLLALAQFAGLIHFGPGQPPPGFHALTPFNVGGVSVPDPFTALGNVHDTLLSATGLDVRIPAPIPGLPKPFVLGRPGGLNLTFFDFEALMAAAGAEGDSSSGTISEKFAMPYAVQIVLDFSQQNGEKVAGWSEQYQTADTNLGSANIMMARYSALINARLNMCAAGVTCTGVRFVLLEVGIPPFQPTSRQVTIAPGPPPAIAAGTGLPYYNFFMAAFPCDFSGTKFLLRPQTAPVNGQTYRRSVWIGGLPDNFDTPLRTQMQPGPWTFAEPIFESFFQPGLFGSGTIKIRSIDRSINFPLLPCTAVSLDGLSYTVPAHGMTEGQVINATRWACSKGGCKPSGLYRAHVIDASTIQLRNAVASARVTKLGSFRIVNYLINNIASVTDRSFSNRKQGRPLNQSRGKSPKRLATRA